MRIQVDPPMLPYAELALARLRYLYTAVEFSFAENTIEVRGASEASIDTIVREVRYALYREKIYAETLPLRRALIEAVTRK